MNPIGTAVCREPHPVRRERRWRAKPVLYRTPRFYAGAPCLMGRCGYINERRRIVKPLHRGV